MLSNISLIDILYFNISISFLLPIPKYHDVSLSISMEDIKKKKKLF